MSDLIDTTEMYLRTIFELEEEGVVPLRARIAERLHQSGPTVSQTVSRMQRDGLLVVSDDRHLELTPLGRTMATRVMRRHRLAECLLIDVIGMPWEDVHHEACRWEHVMSEAVERRLIELLGFPTVSPYGNPIPGLAELAVGDSATDNQAPSASPNSSRESVATMATAASLQPLSAVAGTQVRHVTIRRIAEPVQTNEQAMLCLRRAGAVPGAAVTVVRSPGGISIGSSGEFTELGDEDAVHVLVEVQP